MPKLHFYKYQGTGNDFVMIDNRKNIFPKEKEKIEWLCHRKFGIGADGLMLIEEHADYDFELIYYNADGSQSLCGNGSRCAVHFAQHLEIINEETTFLAYDGPHDATIKEGKIHLKMNDVNEVKFIKDDFFINTGSPHYIKFVDKVGFYNVYEEGKKIRNSESFKKEGTNVNFVEIKGDNDVFVRTYERGVEDETLSCGTGVTASVLAASYKNLKSPVNVKVLGGNLQIAFKNDGPIFKDIYLIGPAEIVFKGEIEI